MNVVSSADTITTDAFCFKEFIKIPIKLIGGALIFNYYFLQIT